ncbi:hypothetical protein [Actinokineospora diospyrosa]|uniref:DUF2637 domain-containing protein n=1 Tax=Actinokineospora diospyrosa TaxID=103728 RepID=A0ABT1I6F7_9PSEU|nr:hypothetical protein [Actinokineospora diospyrosa]MCP2268177.1 hypothetical protein [Actinokineospora diospyrosa]
MRDSESSGSVVDRLATQAAEAAQVRALTTHPDVVALRVEKVRAQVDVLMWLGIGLGLAFTMVNVQVFAAAGAALFSLAWCAAWLLDPMVSLVLIAVLRAEQITARWQVPVTGPWAWRTKVFAFAGTYTMNTWSSWAQLHAAGIVLHSVPPVLVLAAAEAGPYLRDRLTEAVLLAARSPLPSQSTPPVVPASPHAPETVSGPADVSAPSPVDVSQAALTAPEAGTGGGVEQPPTIVSAPRSQARSPRRQAPVETGRRRLLSDFTDQARAALTADTHLTPAWVRATTGCSRSVSTKVAAALRAERDASNPESGLSSVDTIRDAA